MQDGWCVRNSRTNPFTFMALITGRNPNIGGTECTDIRYVCYQSHLNVLPFHPFASLASRWRELNNQGTKQQRVKPQITLINTLRLTAARVGAISSHESRSTRPLGSRADSHNHFSRHLGWRLEVHWHVEERAQQTTRLVHLHRHLQHHRHPAYHLSGVVSERPQPALI